MNQDENQLNRRVMFGLIAGGLHLTAKYAGLTDNISELCELPRRAARAGRRFAVTAKASEPVRFFTDFTERHPLNPWDVQLRDGLIVEPYGDGMAAVPAGSSLLKPAANMTDGEATFDFTIGNSKAGFLYRARNHRACYVAEIRRISRKGHWPVLTLTVSERRAPEPDRVIAVTTISNQNIANLHRHRFTLAMRGNSFTASLHEWKTYWNLGQTAHLEPVRVLSWTDPALPSGSVGAWTPPVRVRAQRDFRLLAVTIATQGQHQL